jgi:hypothetical protein
MSVFLNAPSLRVYSIILALSLSASLSLSIYIYIQGDQKVSVHLMITIQEVTSNVQNVPLQSPDIYWHAELCCRSPPGPEGH